MDEGKTFSEWLENKYNENEKKSILSIFNTTSVLLIKTGVIKNNINKYKDADEIDLLLKEINYAGKKAIHSKKTLSECIKVIQIYKEYRCTDSGKNKLDKSFPEANRLVIDSIEYSGNRVEQILKDADIDGCTLNEILSEVTDADRGIRPLRNWLKKQRWAIEYPNQRYLHMDNFFELMESADVMCTILEKQFKIFCGYTNADVYYDAVCNELKMFLNDNAIKDKDELFCLTRYLFEKIQYKGHHFYFYWGRHIFQKYPSFKVNDANVLKHFIKDNGGIASKEECLDYLRKLKMSYSNPNSLLGIGKSEDVIMYDETHYVSVESLNIDDDFKKKLEDALNLILNEFPYIVPRQLNDVWFEKLPELPSSFSWNLLLLQEIIEKFLPEYRMVPVMEGQSFTTIKAGIVKKDSIIVTSSDLVHAMMVVGTEINLPKRFNSEEFRDYLLKNGIIFGRQLNYANQLMRAFTDRRFAWSSDQSSVLILEK